MGGKEVATPPHSELTTAIFFFGCRSQQLASLSQRQTFSRSDWGLQ